MPDGTTLPLMQFPARLSATSSTFRTPLGKAPRRFKLNGRGWARRKPGTSLMPR